MLTVAQLCNIVKIEIAKLRNMRGGTKMHTVKVDNLEAEMKRKKVSRTDIAAFLGVSYRTIHSRFNGEVQWEYSECVRIRDHFFPECSLEYLFSTEVTEKGE